MRKAYLNCRKRQNPPAIYFDKKTSYIEALRETESDFRFVYLFLIHSVVQRLAQGKKSIEISNQSKLCRDHRTVSSDSLTTATRGIEATKVYVEVYQDGSYSREVARHPLSTSKRIFEDAGNQGIRRTSRCRILKSVAKADELNPPLANRHKILRIEWAKCYMKTDFQTVLFKDECRATLDGPDG